MQGDAMKREEGWRSELPWALSLFVLAFALRGLDVPGGRWAQHACGAPFIQQVAAIIQSGNPLHFEVFFYPPVPAIIVASFAGVWRVLGGGGEVAVQCGVVGLIFALATVAVVYVLGRFWGRPHGLIAMAFYAVTMSAVLVRHGNVQVYSTFFVSLAMYGVLRSGIDGRIWTCTLAGIWLGLGVASKYSPMFFIGMLLVPHILRRRSSGRVVDGSVCPGLDARKEAFLARIWVGSAWVAVGLALAMLWVGLMESEFLYGQLRQIYEQHSHENPFEYHLPWINRLYRAGLAGVGLVGMIWGLAILIPRIHNVPPWEWTRSFFVRNRFWVAPCIGFIVTIVVTMGLPAAFNLNDFTRHFVHIAKGRASGDNGFFPEHRPAPSYIGAYIPESTGVPLYAAGLLGLLYPLLRRDKRVLLLIASAIPAYLVLELSRVKVNRYAMELFPLWCLLSGIWLGDLCQQRRKAWRLAGLAVVLTIVTYSAVYSLAWAEFFNGGGDVRREAGVWLNSTVPTGTSLGAKSALLVTGSPELLPDSGFLAPYRLVDYTEEPEYVLLPNAVHGIVIQYLDGLEKGYTYTADDWFVSTPTATDLDILSRIVREEGYLFVKEFRKRPVIFGMELGSDALTGRTWNAEHSSAIGIRIYRRIAGRR